MYIPAETPDYILLFLRHRFIAQPAVVVVSGEIVCAVDVGFDLFPSRVSEHTKNYPEYLEPWASRFFGKMSVV